MTARYKHHSGKIYELIGTAKNATKNASPVGCMFVVYRSLKTGKLHVREFDEFFGHLTNGSPRFAPVDGWDETVNVVGDTVAVNKYWGGDTTGDGEPTHTPRAPTSGGGRASVHVIRRRK